MGGLPQGVCALRDASECPAQCPPVSFTPADAGANNPPQNLLFRAGVSEIPWEVFLEGNDLEPHIAGFL